MADNSVKKIDSSASPTGEMGQTYLVSGTSVAMRLWSEPAGTEGEPHTRPYETVGYVVSGKVEVHVADSVVTCGAGDSYLVPEGAERRYKITEDLTAVEATSPPARVNDRDDASSKQHA
ncbi:cupin domain-containing protein [Rubrivirga sp.]|uniref:cupin domain-containing protein n=1 Tax=Rubrivirga sp. TaxID=1885344 RepID=UPI003C77836D